MSETTTENVQPVDNSQPVAIVEEDATVSKTVNRSVSLGMQSSTLADLQEAAALVGAPSNAVVSSNNGMYQNSQNGEYYPYSVTFSWSEQL